MNVVVIYASATNHRVFHRELGKTNGGVWIQESIHGKLVRCGGDRAPSSSLVEDFHGLDSPVGQAVNQPDSPVGSGRFVNRGTGVRPGRIRRLHLLA